MPIKDSEGNVLVYNGEIFDQRSLNSKCKQKIDFKKEGIAKLLFQYLKEETTPHQLMECSHLHTGIVKQKPLN